MNSTQGLDIMKRVKNTAWFEILVVTELEKYNEINTNRNTFTFYFLWQAVPQVNAMDMNIGMEEIKKKKKVRKRKLVKKVRKLKRFFSKIFGSK